MITVSSRTPPARIATIVVSALAFVLSVAAPVHAADLPNCAVAETTPCFEEVWADGGQFKMTFVDFNPTPFSPSDVNFYLVAQQTGRPQGSVPFIHDHVTDGKRSHKESHGRNHADLNVHYHGFLVFCSAQGIAGGACVPTMTASPQGILPFAKTVDGHRLTSNERIESAANSGIVTLVDTGAVFVARIEPGDGQGECD